MNSILYQHDFPRVALWRILAVGAVFLLAAGLVSSRAQEYIWMEAESADLTEPMQIGDDGTASGGGYVFSAVNGQGTVEFTMTVLGGSYTIWAQCAATLPLPTAHDSYWVSVDGGPEDVWDMNNDNPDGPPISWAWDSVSTRCGGTYDNHLCDPYVLDLAEGEHTIRFRCRETLARLDQIVLTDDLSFDPRGEDPPVVASVTLGWDAPTQNVDGSPVSALGGFKVYFGSEFRIYTNVLDVGNQNIATIAELSPHAMYHFAVTAYDEQNVESDFSEDLVWKYDDADFDALSDRWEEKYFGNATGPASAPKGDFDGDGMSNEQEFIAGTNPTNGVSRMAIVITQEGGIPTVSFVANDTSGVGYEIYDRYVSLEQLGPETAGTWSTVSGLDHVKATGQTAHHTVNSIESAKCVMFRANVSLEPKGL